MLSWPVWGPGHGPVPPPPGGERGALREGGGKASAPPTPGLCLSEAPGRRGVAGVRGEGGLSRKRKCCQASPAKKKASKVQGPWPLLPQPLVRKSAKHYHKKGVSEGPSA